MQVKYLWTILLTILQVKLYCIGVDDNIERNIYLENRCDSKHRTEFPNGYFSHHILDFLSFYVFSLHIRYKLLCSNALFQNPANSSVANNSVLLYCLKIEIKHFNINTKFPNANSVLSHYSIISNIK
jgi:hypothetical protein